MKKLVSISSYLNRQIISQQKNINLTFKSQYFARSTKRKPNSSEQEKKQQTKNNNDSQQNSKKNEHQNQNKNNFQSKEQNINKSTHVTGPKTIIQLMKKGNTKIIPFYIKAFKNPIRNMPLPFQKKIQQLEQKVQKSSDKKQKNEQSQNNIKIETKESQKTKPFKFNYPIKSSYQFQQRLIKKYKIIQALKAKTKTSYINKLFAWEDLKQFQSLHFLSNPQYRNGILKISFYILLLTAYLVHSAMTQVVPNAQPIYTVEKGNQLSESQLINKVRQLKQINILTTPQNKTNLVFVLNQDRKLTFLENVVQLFGFNVQKNKKVTFQVKNPNIVLDGLQKVQQSIDNKQWIKVKPIQPSYSYINALIDTLFLATPFIGIAITYWIFTKMNPESMMKGLTSNKKSMKIQSTKDIKVRFKDVAGMENAKKQITQFVDFLKKSQKYVEMGAKIPKGALLTGPPGTGKTMLAKACAGQAGTSFFYVSGSQFVQMFVGLGASRVRQLFARARQQAPSIIFIDQIDAIGKKRQTSRNQQKDSTLNQMLVEMDGFSSSQTVIVLAATNRKDILDSALTRPGRFDRMVEITLPEIKARQQIFMVHLAPLKVNPNKPLPQLAKRLAQLTPGFSGADIANLCNQAAIIATRKKRNFIQDDDFQQASERIMAGYVKKGLSNKKTKKRVAYHQAGHAVCGWYLKGGDPLVKLTIIPRSKGALGYAQYLPKTAYIRTKSQLIDQIAIMLGGTTSEQIFLGNMSSGNSDDLQKVYGVARRMIAQFGMGSKTYNMTIDQQTYVKKQSQKLCNLIDQQILQVVNEATSRAKNIIEQKRQIVEQLAKQLLQKQTINDVDILRIMGARPSFT